MPLLLQCSAWNSLQQPLLEAMDDVGEGSQQKTMETEQPLYYHMHVGTITYYLSIPLCGQLGSSNHSALFILTNDLSLTCTFIIDPSFFTCDSALSFLVICMQCYIYRTMWCPSTYGYSALK